ncbi:Histone acetyltransferase, partial [Trichinella zimbabwensis]
LRHHLTNMSDRPLQTKGLDSVEGKETIHFTEFLTEEQGKLRGMCTCCKRTTAIWHCTICVNFDLCQACYENSNHEHEMEEINPVISSDIMNLGEYLAHDADSIRNECISRMKEEKDHYDHCLDNDCSLFYCQKKKRILDHMLVCYQSVNCKYYRQFLKLRSLHAGRCNAKICIVEIHQKMLQESRKLSRPWLHCNMNLELRLQSMSSASGEGDLHHHADLGNFFVDCRLAHPRTALLRSEVVNGRICPPLTCREDQNAELEWLAVADGADAAFTESMMAASIMEEESAVDLFNPGLEQQDSAISCQPAITTSVKVVEEQIKDIQE